MSLTQSYIKGTIPTIEEKTYSKHAYEIFTKYSNKIGYIFKSFQHNFIIRNTYGELIEIINRIIQGFQRMKINRQDVICLFLPNALDYIYTELAAWCGGYILMSLNPLFTKPQLERLLPKVNPKVIVTSKLMRGKLPDGYNFCYIDLDTVEDVENGIYSMMKIKATPGYIFLKMLIKID